MEENSHLECFLHSDIRSLVAANKSHKAQIALLSNYLPLETNYDYNSWNVGLVHEVVFRS